MLRAGPSEVLVVADAGASPAHVAADLLSQAEHGPDSQVVLVSLPGADVRAIQEQVEVQCSALPRNDTARKALSHSYAVQVGVCASARARVCVGGHVGSGPALRAAPHAAMHLGNTFRERDNT